MYALLIHVVLENLSCLPLAYWFFLNIIMIWLLNWVNLLMMLVLDKSVLVILTLFYYRCKQQREKVGQCMDVHWPPCSGLFLHGSGTRDELC